MLVNKETTSKVRNLSRSLHEKETEIELLQQTFTEIGSELDLDKVFQIVSARAIDLINAETILIPLLDDNCETYTYRGGAGKNAEEIVGESLPLEYGVCGWVWQQKKPWWLGVLDELMRGKTRLMIPLVRSWFSLRPFSNRWPARVSYMKKEKKSRKKRYRLLTRVRLI